jgi:hypothetical protein
VTCREKPRVTRESGVRAGVQCGRSVQGFQCQREGVRGCLRGTSPLLPAASQPANWPPGSVLYLFPQLSFGSMDCSPDPGTAAGLDRPPCDIVVCIADPFGSSLPIEFVSSTDNLRRAGLRVENELPLFIRPTPARVNVIIVLKCYVSTYFLLTVWRGFMTVMRSGIPVIPVYWDVGPDEVQVELERAFRAHGLRRGSSLSGDVIRRLLTISGHDLARYDG